MFIAAAFPILGDGSSGDQVAEAEGGAPAPALRRLADELASKQFVGPLTIEIEEVIE